MTESSLVNDDAFIIFVSSVLPKKADSEVKILIKRHLVALGGEKGQNFIFALQHSFIYHSKAKDELNPKKEVLSCFDITWWR